jgi:hypothetical protein
LTSTSSFGFYFGNTAFWLFGSMAINKSALALSPISLLEGFAVLSICFYILGLTTCTFIAKLSPISAQLA